MPSKTKKQHNLMAMVAHDPAAAKRLGIKQSVGAEFMKADKGRKFGKGGEAHEEKGEMKKDIAQDKKLIKKAISMHDKQEHKGSKGTNLSKLKTGGVAKTVTKEMEYDYKTGKKSFSGSTAQRDAHAEKEGKIVAKHAAYDKAMGMKSGGTFRTSANGIAKKGLTKGTQIKMCGGGSAMAKKK